MVDSDEDLVALCARMQENNARQCAILFCDEDVEAPRSVRPTPLPGRTLTH